MTQDMLISTLFVKPLSIRIVGIRNPVQAEIENFREQLAETQAIVAEVARIKAVHADLEARNALLELQNERMCGVLYGQRSERTWHLLDQMELVFKECEASASKDEALGILAAAKVNAAPFERKRPARRPLPEHLPRERVCLTNNAAEWALKGIATTDSYCTSSSNIWKQGLLVFHFDAIRASATRELDDLLLLQVRSSYLVRGIRHNLLGWQYAFFDQPTNMMGRDTKLLGGFGQREPLAILFIPSISALVPPSVGP